MEIKHRIDLIKLLPKNPITCEIGVAEGNFSRDICQQWKPTKHYLVDNWGTLSGTGDGSFPQDWHDKNYQSAMKKMIPFEEIIEVLRGASWNMAQLVPRETLDLLYLDANHTYDGVMKDLEAWAGKVKKGGVIAFHDYENQDYGVKAAVNAFASRTKTKVHLIPELKWEDAGAYFIV
jgi:hypothetical protein